MTTFPVRLSRNLQRHAAVGVAPLGDRLGIVFPLLLVWIFFEYGRPATPFKIPLLISLISVLAWLFRREKQWTPQSWWWVALLGAMVIGIPLAGNTFSAFWATRDMAVLLVCICLPLQSLLTSVRKVKLFVYTFLAVALYVGGWAASHGGFGPSGAGGGQDENYVAALMGMAIAFAYFSLFAEKRRIVKLLLALSMVVFVAAIALGQNPSRGGFFGLCAVGCYCLARSPKKLLGFGILVAMVVALVAIAGPAFWAEISTSADYSTGTADTRLEIWKAGFRMWQGNPLFGVGAANFKWALDDYQTAEQVAKFGRYLGGSILAHSLPVELLAELGLAGVIATGALVWYAWTGLGTVRRGGTPQPGQPSVDPELVRLSCYADAIRGGMVAILANGVFLSLLYYSHLWLLIALGLALPFVYRFRIQGCEPAGEPPRMAGLHRRQVKPGIVVGSGPTGRIPSRRRR